MIHGENRINKRFCLSEVDLVAEYSRIPTEENPLFGLDPLEQYQRQYRSAVVNNISRGGICISIDDPNLDVGIEVELFLTVTDPEPGGENVSQDFAARAVWISEDTTGFRVGLEFTEVPEGFSESFDRLMTIVECEHSLIG